MNNRATRILVAVLTIPFLLGLSYWGDIPFLILILGIGLFSFNEYAEIVKNKDHHVDRIFGNMIILIIILNTYFFFVEFEPLILLGILLLLIAELFRNRGSAIQNLGSTLLGILYIGTFSSAIISVREFYSDTLHYQNGGWIIISIFITLWMTDSAAYFLGSAFGKHKLFPRVSPNKSWEGALAGFLFAMVTIVVLKTFVLLFLTWLDAIVFGVIIGLFGQIGDLIESLIKRDAGVKDSSNIIPGHGGILDRFDSLIFSAPIVYLYMYFFM